MKFISDIRLLLTGLWLGAAVFFIAVAQSAFTVLPTREAAGNLVSTVLMILNVSGFGIGLVLFLTSLIRKQGFNPAQVWAERALTIVLTLSCGIGQFVIGTWLGIVKAGMGRPIDEIPVDDPLRVKFNDLHEYSVWVLFAGMAAAMLVFFIIAGKNFWASKEPKF
jgi:hypothetical protein